MVVYSGAVGGFRGSCLGHSMGDMITVVEMQQSLLKIHAGSDWGGKKRKHTHLLSVETRGLMERVIFPNLDLMVTKLPSSVSTGNLLYSNLETLYLLIN